jgi:hypothetical protein
MRLPLVSLIALTTPATAMAHAGASEAVTATERLLHILLHHQPWGWMGGLLAALLLLWFHQARRRSGQTALTATPSEEHAQ